MIGTEVSFPDDDGWTALESLTEEEILRAAPVFVLSIEDGRQLGIESGAADCLIKPVNGEQIRTLFERLSPMGETAQ